MICNCQSCHTAFWRYRRDWPPKGFCSLPCAQIGPQKEGVSPGAAPPTPDVVLADMRAHRRFAHNAFSPLGWFDCRKCEELEADYAASLEYHFSESTEILVADANRRWNRVVHGEGVNNA